MPRHINDLVYSIETDEERLQYCVVKIDQKTFKDRDGNPTPGGLYDSQLGSYTGFRRCTTCNKDHRSCNGHFGFIQLCVPVYNPLFLNQTKNLMSFICFYCGRPRTEDPMKKSVKPCIRCSAPNIHYDLGCHVIPGQSEYKILLKTREKYDGISGFDRLLDPQEVHQKLKTANAYLNEHDLPKLGFGQDQDISAVMMSVFPVPPTVVRLPSEAMNGHDDLTFGLKELLSANEGVEKALELYGVKSKEFSEAYNKLQLLATTYIKNDQNRVPTHTSHGSKPTKSIVERLSSKRGRIRNNIMGKRGNYCARSVITGDPTLMMDQVGVPKTVAERSSYPVRVCVYNYAVLSRLLANSLRGMVYPCIKSIERLDAETGETQTIHMKSFTPKTYYDENDGEPFALRYGDIVHRTLMDGDFIVFNRQPTLHKMSMMGFRVKVLAGDSFRINVAVTPPFNADFDKGGNPLLTPPPPSRMV